MTRKTAARHTVGDGGPGQGNVTVNRNNTTTGAKNQVKFDDMLRAALSFIEKGKPVFPCNPADKSPMTQNGFYDASTDPATIKRWWAKNPGAAIGVPTGEKSGWVVVDKDDYKAEFDQAGWLAILEEIGGLPETLTQRTGGGGTQYIFQHPGHQVKCKNGLITGVDIKGDGGYIIVAPSPHPSGNHYKWKKKVDPASLPPALLDIINGKNNRQEPPPPRQAYHPGTVTAWAEKALSEESNRVATAAENTRNDVLNRAAFSLGQIVAGGGLDRSTVEAELMSAAAAAGLTSKEIPKTIQSGMKAGAGSPRTAPEPTWTRDACDTTKTEASHRKASIDGGCDTGDTCDAVSDNKKTFSLPRPPLDAFHPDIKAAILNIAETKQCPVEVPVSALLALVSGMVGRARCITIKKGWSEPGNTFIGLVAKTGVGKSPATNSIFRPVYKIEKKNEEKYQQEMDAYEMAMVAWQKQKDPEEPKPQPPGKKETILDDWTIESTADALVVNPKGLLLYRDELAGMLLDMDKYTGEKGSTKTRLMTAYDTKKPWKISRANKKRAGYIQNPCVSLYGGIQDEVACELFQKGDQVSGFLGRIIFILAIQKRAALFTEDEETEHTTRTIDHLARALEKIDLVDGNSKYIGVKEEAKRLYISWHDALSREAWLCMDDGENGLISKVRAQGLRICLLLHIIEKVMDDQNEMEAVSPDTMTRALVLMDWLRAHTKATWQMLKQKAQAPTGQAVRVAQAIFEIQDQIEGGWLSTQAITDQTNKGQDARFHLQSDNVGRICTSLGLEKKATREARGFLIKADDITRLSEYLPTKQVSQASQESQAFNDGAFGVTLPKTMCHKRHTTDTGDGQDDVEFF